MKPAFCPASVGVHSVPSPPGLPERMRGAGRRLRGETRMREAGRACALGGIAVRRRWRRSPGAVGLGGAAMGRGAAAASGAG